MKYLLTLCVGLGLVGCTVGVNPTTQQIVQAKEGNIFIAHTARLGFEELATQISADPKLANNPNIQQLEDAIKPLLDEMDLASVGDPSKFTTLTKAEGEKQFALWLNVTVQNVITKFLPKW